MATIIACLVLVIGLTAERSSAEKPLRHTIVLIGPIGEGKSSLANALLGCDPRIEICDFGYCPAHGGESCTKTTTIVNGSWRKEGDNITVRIKVGSNKSCSKKSFPFPDC